METDYNNQINKAREQYARTARKLKDSFDASLKNIDETNENRLSEIDRNDKKHTEILVRENQEKLNYINDRTNRLLAQTTKKFEDELNDEREGFVSDRKEIQGKFSKNLNNVTDSYDRTLQEERYQNDVKYKERENQLLDRIDRNLEDKEKQVGEIQTKNEKGIETYKEKLTGQKLELTRKNKAEKADLTRNLNDDIQDQRMYYDRKINEVRSISKDQINRLTEKHENILAQKQDLEDNQLAGQRHTFDKLFNDLSRKSKYQFVEEKRANNLEIQEMNKKHSQDLYNKDKDVEEVQNTIYFNGKEELKQSQMRKHYEKRLKNIRNQLTEHDIRHERRSDDLHEHFRQEMRKKGVSHSKHNEDKEEIFRENLIGVISENRNKQAVQNARFTEELSTQKMNHENLANQNRARNNVEKNILKSDFSGTVNKLRDLNSSNVSELQSEFSKERRFIVDFWRKKLSETTGEQRKTNIAKTKKLIDQYEQKLAIRDRDFKNLQNLYETKKDTMNNNTKKLVNDQVELSEKNRENDRLDSDNRYQDLKLDFERKNQQLRNRFDSELARVRNKNDIKITKLIQNHRDSMERMTSQHQKELKTKVSDVKMEFRRNMKSSKFEKENLISQYEAKIKDIVNRQQLERVQAYKDSKIKV